jgi:hypothetical protein
MADRLLNLIEPDDLGSGARLLAWLVGGSIGAILAAATLLLLLGAHLS